MHKQFEDNYEEEENENIQSSLLPPDDYFIALNNNVIDNIVNTKILLDDMLPILNSIDVKDNKNTNLAVNNLLFINFYLDNLIQSLESNGLQFMRIEPN